MSERETERERKENDFNCYVRSHDDDECESTTTFPSDNGMEYVDDVSVRYKRNARQGERGHDGSRRILGCGI